MRILITHPKLNSAIGRLALDLQKYLPYHEIRLCEVHPKRPDQKQLDLFEELYRWCDIWDCHYWKTGKKLRELYGDILDTKPCMLSHYNPYDLLAESWSDYQINVVCNGTQKRVLKEAVYIPLAIDSDNFPWNPDYTERKSVLMVAQRIESSKGIEQVARACKELGYMFTLVGEISDAEYFNSVCEHGITFLQNISDKELLEVYQNSAVLVCNSKDNFESGTLPILEAMSVGVPVLTRRIGHVPELFNEKNMIVRDGEPDDSEELKALLSGILENRDMALEMREEAWHTARNHGTERRARQYSALYYKLMYPNQALVSVILPVFGHIDRFPAMLIALYNQSYKALEVIVVSDGDSLWDDIDQENLNSITPRPFTFKYFKVGREDEYGLGFARDYGVMESEGEIIVFLDQRFLPDPHMIEEFVKNLHEKQWLFGNKGGKKNFVENVSCIYRQEFITMGMSNQLIEGYGGMSQELRNRSKKQGFKHVFIESALAEPQWASHNYNKRKKEIREMKNRLWKLGID